MRKHTEVCSILVVSTVMVFTKTDSCNYFLLALCRPSFDSCVLRTVDVISAGGSAAVDASVNNIRKISQIIIQELVDAFDCFEYRVLNGYITHDKTNNYRTNFKWNPYTYSRRNKCHSKNLFHI